MALQIEWRLGTVLDEPDQGFEEQHEVLDRTLEKLIHLETAMDTLSLLDPQHEWYELERPIMDGAGLVQDLRNGAARGEPMSTDRRANLETLRAFTAAIHQTMADSSFHPVVFDEQTITATFTLADDFWPRCTICWRGPPEA